jgi:prepilin-type N-terminal cleavage/methylation domain-containing protein
MPACRRRRIFGCRPRAVGSDHGFTLLEVMVSMAVISTVMLALAPMFVTTMRVNHEQSDRQAAIQAADDAMERARAIQVTALLTNRDQASTIAQAVAAPDEVKELLTGDPNNTAALGIPDQAEPYLAWDDAAAAGAGPTAALPTTFNPLTLSGVHYRQQWFIGKCGRATPAEDGAPEDAVRPCQAGQTGSGFTPLYRIVVAVGWTDRLCPTECTYVTTSLISSTTEEPVFSIRDSIQRVKITSLPGTQTDDISVPVSLPFTASGSNVTWKVTGQPAGLTMNAVTGVLSGTPTATVTTGFTTQVTATDANYQEDYVSFLWVINSQPTIVAPPSSITTAGSVAYTKTFTITKPTGTVPLTGTAPYTWSWSGVPTAAWPTGTPPGLAMDPNTGIVSGTPNVVGSNTYVAGVSTGVTVSVTDKFGQVGTRSFTWIVGPALSVGAFTVPTTSKVGTAVSLTVTAAGGIPPYVSWSATGLPTGLSMNPTTGAITGKPTVAKTYFTPVVFTVTDSSADAPSRTASRTVVNWKVAP